MTIQIKQLTQSAKLYKNHFGIGIDTDPQEGQAVILAKSPTATDGHWLRLASLPWSEIETFAHHLLAMAKENK